MKAGLSCPELAGRGVFFIACDLQEWTLVSLDDALAAGFVVTARVTKRVPPEPPGITHYSPQNVSKNSAMTLRVLKASQRVALQFHGL